MPLVTSTVIFWNMNNPLGITSSFLGILAAALMAYSTSSLEMNDSVTQTPGFIMDISMLFVESKPVSEPTFSSVGLLPMADEMKRYYSVVLACILLVIASVFAFIAYYKNENSLFYATGVLASIGALTFISAKVFAGYVLIILLAITWFEKYKKI